ncbi:MAG: calcium-translocating P-type ATPase, PMCA-type [Bacteroidales bacterium]|nr:calcium-translocating P-type ATPase, PMCA-type [Bacteroidales bacterium]
MLQQDSEAVHRGQGKNIIPPPERPSLFWAFLEKFKDPLIIVLLVVIVFSVLVACYEVYQGGSLQLFLEPTGVLVALLLATGVGFVFEVKAGQEFDVLNQIKDDELVKVVRRDADGTINVYKIPKRDVCVGDEVRLEAGDGVPADGHIVHSNRLLVDESAFTGEPFVSKGLADATLADGATDHETTYPADFLLRGSMVVEGMADYEVTAVGTDTEEGRGAASLAEESEVQTPLKRQLDELGKWISIVSFVIAALIVVGRLIYFFFIDKDAPTDDFLAVVQFLLNSIMIAVTLIVVAVPEGLPMSITVSLALSMRKMLKENNLVRRLHACETMGAATVICTDKTGTLTQNRMSVVESVTAEPLSADGWLALGIAVNSTAELNGHQVIGNPTEGALLLWLQEHGIDYRPLRASVQILEQVPFSSQTKYMQTKAQLADGRIVSFIKGAPEVVLSLAQSLTPMEETLALYQGKAYRTLAFAHSLDEQGSWQSPSLVGIADPIRSDVREAIKLCKDGAHVKVIIVTGDTKGTANEIGRQIGLLTEGETDKTLTGPEFAALPEDEARELLRQDRVRIIARARPEDKGRLVQLLQRNGEVVAVTGDGTNDALALHKAQVGLSMGDGTARAKEASDITIIDNSFSSINKAILWGHSLYQNIRRFIIFQMTINVCACGIVLLGAFVGLDSPLNVTQMLWVNLIMDTFAAMALSSLPADPSVMFDYPRSPKAHILDRSMIVRIVGWGILFFVLLAGLWFYLKWAAEAPHLSRHDLGLFFTFFVLIQFWNLFNTRYYHTQRCLLLDLYEALRGVRPLSATYSRGFFSIVLAILLGQVLIMQLGYELFEVAPLSLREWGGLLLITAPILVIPDAVRCLLSRLRK